MYDVELDHVSKTFGDHHAVEDLSFAVPTGSIFGFIGPNGSGKSTTLRMIMHIIHADRGKIRVLGEETHSAANDRIGYLPEERGLYRQMKVVDLLRFFSRLKGHAVSQSEIDGWLERVQLQQWGQRKVEALSKGMSQKVQFLATIIARPKLLLLDEPFSGLDPINAEVVREIMLELVKGGTTVLFSTHDMLAAEALCDQILMIYNGKKVLDGTLRQIQTEHGGDMLRIRLDWPTGSDRQLTNLPGVTKTTDLGNMQELSLENGVDRNQILQQLMQRGKVEHFELTRPSLKDIFLQIAKGGRIVNFGKTFIIAVREYLAAVASKSFIISLVLMPVFMTGGIMAQKLGNKLGDTSDYHVAVMDCSPGASLYPTLESAVREHDEHETLDSSGKQIHAKFELEKVDPVDWRDSAALDKQRLALSDRVRSGELLAFVEIGPAVLNPQKPGPPPEAATVRYSTNRPTYSDFFELLQSKLPSAIIQKRFAAAATNFQNIQPLLVPSPVIQSGLAETSDGKITYQSKSGRIVSTVVPIVMIVMMFIVTLIGTSPIAANVVEEKQLRIAEVLLGSVTPFELMIGKLLGGVAVSLTLASLFFGGAYYLASTYGMAHYVSGQAIAWFFFFTIVGTFMYGALFAAAGAACSNVKEVQSFIMPVMLFIALPMFVLGPMLENPSGPLGVVLSFFPLSAPTVMILRLTIPPGVPLWEPIAGALSALVTTVVLVWAAGRIFRVGILMQGKGANYAAVFQWILRG